MNISNQPDPVQQFLVSQIASYAASLTTGQYGLPTKRRQDPNKTNSGDMGSEGGKKGGNGDADHDNADDEHDEHDGTTVGTLRGFYLKVQAATHQQAIENYSTIAISTHNALSAVACQSLPVLRTPSRNGATRARIGAARELSRSAAPRHSQQRQPGARRLRRDGW